MAIRSIPIALAALGLSGCATLDSSTSSISLAASADEHAEFDSLRAVTKPGVLEVTGWARSKRVFVSGSIHIEARSQGNFVAAVDVPWRPQSHTRLRRHSRSFYFQAKLPAEALSADMIQVSHVHRGHSHTSPEGEAK